MPTPAPAADSEPLALDGGSPCVVDPPPNHLHGPAEIGDEEIEAVTAVLRGQNLFRFNKPAEQSPTAELETLFTEKTGVEHALAVNAGTSALICGMIGLGVEPGDEVIVPGYTYIATAAAALALGAIPVVAEIDETLTLDPADAEAKITDRTRLIVPVHMRGVPCRMDEIMAVADRHGLRVLEDVAQANGGAYRGRPLGSFGHAAAFSMQHYKIVTAGEGGMFVTDDREVFERGACYHDSAYAFWLEKKGQLSIDPFLGQNYRMSELHGALGLAQLRKRDGILARCRRHRDSLKRAAGDLPGLTPQPLPDAKGDCGIGVGWFAETADRAKRIAEALNAEGMTAHSIYRESIPDRHIYTHWNYVLEKRSPCAGGWPWTDASPDYRPDMCPRTLDLLGRVFICPITQQMSEAHIDSCAVALRKVAAAVH